MKNIKYNGGKGNMIERIYTKECYEKIKDKFVSVKHLAECVISNAKPKDILLLEISIKGGKKILRAKIITPTKYLESCVI